MDRIERVLGAAGVQDEGWAVGEFGGVALGDARLRARAVRLVGQVGAQPTASLPQACGAEPGALKAAYRFFDNPAVEPAALLASHVAATYARVRATEVVLAVQDTTELDFSHHPATTGLGALGDTRHRGLFVHSTLALTPDRVPLGLIAQQVWTRDPATLGQLPDHKTRPIADKESQKWLTSVQAVAAAARACPATHLVSIGDREADLYDLFLVPRPAGVDLLVRAVQNRRVEDDHPDLGSAVAAAPVATTVQVAVPRQPGRPARTATLTIRWVRVTLCPPRHRAAEHLPSVPVWVVWATEAAPPPDVTPLDWRLLTTGPVTDATDAVERVDWYACRWGIEVWHKVLKSGCRIEARQLATADHLHRSLALYSVIAWRLLYATLLSRTLPDAPCTVLLEPDEWQALYCRIEQVPTPPATPPPLRQAVRWIAHLGGFPGRRHDGEPGVTVLWRGFQHLADLTAMYVIMKPPRPSQLVGKG